MKKRASGILLHITSLPGKYGIGDFGSEAYHFADFLYKTNQSYWQILPLNPPQGISDISPYNCLSAFAGNVNLINPQLLVDSGYLEKKDLYDVTEIGGAVVDYKKAVNIRSKLFNKLYENFKAAKEQKRYLKFCRDNKYWLDDYALFVGLSQYFQTADWWKWPKQIRNRNPGALKQAYETVKSISEKEKILQYIFFEQWFLLKKYCNNKGIDIIGDIPIYVAYQSADVWANQEIFKLDKFKKPVFVAGVPPDFFSDTGQLWGNPVYKWKTLREQDYQWWINRIGHNLKLYDMVRIDHFRGLVKYWQVPAGHKTAVNGKWVKGPGEHFFKILHKHFPLCCFIVEDLAYNTEDIIAILKKFKLRGMKIIQFAFNGNAVTNPHSLRNHVRNCIVYTGTHDNNTIKGWFKKEIGIKQKKKLFACLGHHVPKQKIHWELIKLAMSSVGEIVIIPMQDILGLGEQARMNTPGTVSGNWIWQLDFKEIKPRIVKKLTELTQTYKRG